MAKKSSSAAIGNWVVVAVAIVGLYLTYKWLTAPRATSGLTNGFVGGGYGGGANSVGASSDQSSQSAVSNLLKGLAKLIQGGQKGGSGVSFGSGGGAAGQQNLSQSLKDQIAAISGFSTAANNTPLSILGGASLNNYDPSVFEQGLIGGDQIAYQPTSLFDLNNIAFDLASDPLGGSTSPQIDVQATGLNDQFIPYEPMQNFDLSGMAFDPGGDLATVPGFIGGPGLSSSFGGDPTFEGF